ncbi:hypothetical protein HMPREF3165_07690 [Actinomyces sp. HMSC08A09]|uniref:hypothetical protein n=1 Tax=Actinomyces sp. HMSC08A09 TaxID=1581133 RepID=UPI0008A175A1|nr:hypothetical protein [Actinomyces sp. HMSC08A09]OFT38020.1 hypothetical protein HMPREF3165_07690 [Actinomyces sp. HMSC08A09]
MSSTSSTTSPNDAGSTSTEATGEDATRPFPAAGDTQPLTAPATQPVTMPLPASQDAGAETASTGSAPASSASSPVWSAGTVTEQDRPQAPQDIKGSTLLWGAFLLLVGGLLIAAGLGLRFDFTTTAIACLAGLGALLVVAALIPKGRRSTKKS